MDCLQKKMLKLCSYRFRRSKRMQCKAIQWMQHFSFAKRFDWDSFFLCIDHNSHHRVYCLGEKLSSFEESKFLQLRKQIQRKWNADFSDFNLIQYSFQPAHMILVNMSDHKQVDVHDTHVLQVINCSNSVRSSHIFIRLPTAAVHQHRETTFTNQDCISITYIYKCNIQFRVPLCYVSAIG